MHNHQLVQQKKTYKRTPDCWTSKLKPFMFFFLFNFFSMREKICFIFPLLFLSFFASFLDSRKKNKTTHCLWMFHIYAVSMGVAVVVSSVYLPLSLPSAAKRPLARRSKIALRSLSIFNLTMTHYNWNEWKNGINEMFERIWFDMMGQDARHSVIVSATNTCMCVCVWLQQYV